METTTLWKVPDEYQTLSQDCLTSLEEYVNFGAEPGHFLRSVLENELVGAFARADLENRARMFEWVRLVNSLPLYMRKDKQSVWAWMESGGVMDVYHQIIKANNLPKGYLTSFVATSCEGVALAISSTLELDEDEQEELTQQYEESPCGMTLCSWLRKKYGSGNFTIANESKQGEFEKYRISVYRNKKIGGR